jgi:hypothetical protein
MFDVRTTGDTAHIDMIFKFLSHMRASTWVHRYSSLLQLSLSLGQRGHVGGSFAYFARNAHCTITTDLLLWYSNIQKDFSPGATIFSLHTLASPSGRNVNYDEKQLTGEKNICSFYLYRFRTYVSYGFPIINFCNFGVHFQTPCIMSFSIKFLGRDVDLCILLNSAVCGKDSS